MSRDNLKSMLATEAHAATIGDGFSFAAVGDFIGPFRPEVALQNPAFDRVCQHLQNADIALGNQEGSIFDMEGFKGYRAAEHGGGYPLSDVVTAHDIKAMGIDVMSKANNHATDWGVEGLIATTNALKAAGIAHAGSGLSRATARSAVFLVTSKGRVGFVSAAATFTPMSEAGNTDDEVAARPGISVLRIKPIVLVAEQEMTAIQTIAKSLGASDGIDCWLTGDDKQVNFGPQTFRISETNGLTYDVNELDRKEVLRAIRGAKQLSNFVAFTLHAHESRLGSSTDRKPADYVPALLRDAIDSGADLVTVTGPHVLRGIEIYRRKPIFYGLGSFFLQLADYRGPTNDAAMALGLDPLELTKPEYINQVFRLPDDWYDSMVATSIFKDGWLSEVRVHPLVLERNSSPRLEGAPRPAPSADAVRILDRLRLDCLEFGTKMVVEEGVGIIRVQT